MNQKVTINHLSTSVPGLDEVLGGGLPEYSFNVIGGSPGSGKTTLAHQLMFALATPDRPALYLTVLGEPPLKMLRYQQQFSFFNNDLINRAIRFVNLADDTLSGDLDQVRRRVESEMAAHRPAFVFVDSFRSVVHADASGGIQANLLQHFMQQFGMLMTSWKATTFLIGEYGAQNANPVFTVADGILWLHQSVLRNSMVRKIEILKMRGQPAMPGLHTFRISKEGVRVFAPVRPTPLSRDEHDEDRPLDRLSLGVPLLDEMLGGGLPRGHSLLVAGPSGSGKSILAAAFLAEGVRCGEKCVLASFEQRPGLSRYRGLAKLIDNGSVAVVDSRSADLSIDEIVLEIISEIRRLNATRIVIDSLSGFELAVAPTFKDDFRESLARMVFALADTGATALMTSELEDRYVDLRFSPYGTAFLTDAIIVQRYIEVDSRLERVIAVVKVRASTHSNELRRYHIDATGLQVGERLADQEGLLGGRPTHKAVHGSSRRESP